jgi:hypothetical protein
MRRRDLIIGTAAVAVLGTTRLASAEPGISAAPDLFAAITGLRGISEGSGRGTLHILYAPWCTMTPTLYEHTRAYLSRLRLNWIPFSGGQPEGRAGTELLLRSGSAADIPRFFTHVNRTPAIGLAPLADAQDAALGAIMPLYYRDAGGGLSTPTLFYRLAGDRIRIVKGAPQPFHLEQIAAVAA